MKTWKVVILTILGILVLLLLLGWAARAGAAATQVAPTPGNMGGTSGTPPIWDPNIDMGGNGVLL